jgi:ribulose-5-phosphate 4-epimerase/fuculose-1-phosphate aldolase
MILRNHGLLTCGASVADAFAEMYHLQRACEVQLAAQASGANLCFPPPDVVRKTGLQFDKTAREAGQQNELLFGALRRRMGTMSKDAFT